MLRGHHRRQLPRDVQLRGVFGSRGGRVLARENRPGVNGLALGVNKRVSLVKRLRRRKPLEGGASRTSFRENQDLRLVGDRNGERLAENGVRLGRGKGKRKRGKRERVENGGDGERTGVESECAGIRRGEREERGGGNGGRREVEVESEGYVGG